MNIKSSRSQEDSKVQKDKPKEKRMDPKERKGS